MPRLPVDPLGLVEFTARKLGLAKAPSEDAPPQDVASNGHGDPPATPARVGKYDQSLADQVAEHPGLTISEAAERIGVAATSLYPVLRRLEANGQVVKLGRELHPSPAPGTRLEKLWCDEGHWWTRVAVRGRKPKRCLQHR